MGGSVAPASVALKSLSRSLSIQLQNHSKRRQVTTNIKISEVRTNITAKPTLNSQSLFLSLSLPN